MIVKTGLNEYKVWWEYYPNVWESDINPITMRNPNAPVTVCCITAANYDSDIAYKAYTSLYYKDQFCKNKARKYSMAKLLKETFPGPENKETRRLFWNTYFKESPKRKQ